ncbi:alpha/beta hydrolase [Xylella taiwanensis]|uniref:Alpha/beta hydrolase n=1 Tax=Xylella taiwanensis TaxID=1444770 RepID=Z9JI33_9GAMM|nr:alpha/beta hydrolase [Xylella taiwanensis]AXI83416.1 carboxylesterase [Xylella taiwanensis]EWS77476.1 carboxylesterase [Xylella taiwanensis]MCD8456486.1 alpha/beta hydrolase [Xylella taiwanensis]MCD8458893.1 alpha/beta hydrolase [Xylella taiwanensis]MCD8461030.1 alpha/beta hydrolase [Xylella taiwanensis]
MLETIEHETAPMPQWSVLWLHGLGADGHDFMPIVPELVRPHWPALRFVFPHAPVRPITINNGVPMRGWYDLLSLDFNQRADQAGIEAAVVQVEALMVREQERGIASKCLFLAGFSQGGAVVLSTGLRCATSLAGLIALSTYLPDTAGAAARLLPGSSAQPLFMAHGRADPVVPLVHGQSAAETLRKLGFAVDWHTYPMAHQVCQEEIQTLGDWLERRFAVSCP